ncbi:hypothetical protein WNZ14_22455 [Hoeflea sp. AS60]|uniref:hypothetical protein n=1 Tax=Hoeflea sp. AS60 TaxID=3135780 RepID=UPI00317A5DBC
MKTTSLEIQMLDSLIDEPKRTRTAATTVGIADMTEEQHRAYKAKLQRESRKAIAKKKSVGDLPFNTETTRDALADAAISLLASNANGADAIRAHLASVFPDKSGVPFTVSARARSGELKTKLPGRPAK